MRYMIIAAAVFIVVLPIVFIIGWIRNKRFHPSTDKQKQQRELNTELKETGFAYDLEGDYFYSLMDCWQREVGYCRLYDEAAPLFNMIMDCEPVTFSYGGKRWLIEFWKGQYGITTGGEIGIYNTTREDIDTDKFRGVFYENIGEEEMMDLSFVLKRKGKVLIRRKARHWWLTGFKLGEFSQPDNLTMDAKLVFPNLEMRDAFVESLRNLGYGRRNFSVRRKTVSVYYEKPHSAQPEARNKVQEALVQQVNNNNCKLYEFATVKYSDTLDKLEYIKAMMPEVYTIFLHSLYAKGIYDAFGWIKKWLDGGHSKPDPHPVPPEPPCRPKPECPPEPCCKPDPCCEPEPCHKPKPCCEPELRCEPKPCCEPESCCEPKPCCPMECRYPSHTSQPDCCHLEEHKDSQERCANKNHADFCHKNENQDSNGYSYEESDEKSSQPYDSHQDEARR